jgi:hypothetical protein
MATPSVEPASLAPTPDVVSTGYVQSVSIPSAVFVNISADNHSPPLYLQHSALLI